MATDLATHILWVSICKKLSCVGVLQVSSSEPLKYLHKIESKSSNEKYYAGQILMKYF